MNKTVTETTQLASIEAFCQAAELLSFVATARKLGVSPAAVSRTIGRLETRLQTQLFVRSTRKVSLTLDGLAYYEHCREALNQLRHAEQMLSGGAAAVGGKIRISLPTTYAHYRALPKLRQIAEQYPQLQLDIDVRNSNIDFFDEGFDLAIRLGALADSRIVARKLEDAPLGLYAHPDYLRRHGKPSTIKQLAAHQCLHFRLASTGRVMPWLIAQDDGSAGEFTGHSSYLISGDPLTAVRLAAQGAGIVQTFRWIAESDDFRQQLVEVCPSTVPLTRPFHLIYPLQRHLSPRVRVVVDALILALQKPL